MKNKSLLIILLLFSFPFFSKAKSQDSVWYVHSFKISVFKFIPRAEFGGIYEYRFYKRNIVGVKLAYHESIKDWTNKRTESNPYKVYRGPVIGLHYNFVTDLRWHEMIGIQLLYKDFKMFPETQYFNDRLFYAYDNEHRTTTLKSSKEKLYSAQLFFTTHPKHKLINLELGFGMGVDYFVIDQIIYAQTKTIDRYTITYTTFANPTWQTKKYLQGAFEITCNLCFDFKHRKYK